MHVHVCVRTRTHTVAAMETCDLDLQERTCHSSARSTVTGGSQLFVPSGSTTTFEQRSLFPSGPQPMLNMVQVTGPGGFYLTSDSSTGCLRARASCWFGQYFVTSASQSEAPLPHSPLLLQVSNQVPPFISHILPLYTHPKLNLLNC